MKRVVLLAVLLLAMVAGCAADKSQELFETAQFEEKQNNKEHAQKLYREIVEKYPGSPVAKQAEARLAELGRK